jgi:hypothetical protein
MNGEFGENGVVPTSSLMSWVDWNLLESRSEGLDASNFRLDDLDPPILGFNEICDLTFLCLVFNFYPTRFLSMLQF